jgi:hypothetical protein
MLSSLLTASRTTADCDCVLCQPAAALDAVESAARLVAAELGLPENWFNSDARLRADTLPADWRSRAILVGMYGQLHVLAIGRLDLIAMKFIAGRPQDIDDLNALGVDRTDGDFVRKHLESLARLGTPMDQVDEARALLNAWSFL